MKATRKTLRRRTFLKTTGTAVAAQVLGFPAVLNAATVKAARLAAVGAGGKGYGDIRATSKGHVVVALCDVDQVRAANGRRAFPQARFYTDWRRMLEKEAKNLDGITVSTPDHMHAPVTMTALSLGLATYTQKPLSRTVYEARQLRLAAAKAGVATQMGTQHHSGLGYRTVLQWIRQGVIGRIKEAHAWSNRPIWPQGLDRPSGSDPIPDTLDWDKWLGVAPKRPYKETWPKDSGYSGPRNVYVPFAWRGWYDFGAGALGDMGCHIIDPIYWSLELTAPNWVQYEGPEPKPEMFPAEETLTYEFPGTRYTTGDTIRVKWYDGGRKPSLDLLPGSAGTGGRKSRQSPGLPKNGSLFVGTEGVLVCPHGGMPALYPSERFRDVAKPKLESWDHYTIWSNAIRGDRQTNCSFAYAGPLAETVLLGVVASRVPGQRLEWDPAHLRFRNSAAANRFVRPQYRSGWQVPGLG